MKKSDNIYALASLQCVEQLRTRLEETLKDEYNQMEPARVRRAVAKALALAKRTEAPLLVLPILAEEYVQRAGAVLSRACFSNPGGSMVLAA